MKVIKNFIFTLLSFLVFILLYIEISNIWTNYGGIRSNIFHTEIPLLFVLFLLFYFPLKHRIKNALLITVPILGLYILYDIFYSFLARSPRFSDFNNITVLHDFSIVIPLVLLLVVLFLVFNLIYLVYSAKKDMHDIGFYTLMAIKLMLVISLFFLLPKQYIDNILLKKFDYYSWSQSRTIKKNGRFTSTLYYTIQSEQTKEKLLHFKDKNISINTLLFDNQSIKNKRNVYIVILESFIDPRLIKDTTFNRTPLSDNMKKYLTHSEFSYTNASIYGGGTAQSEFEILTGIPALAKINSIEFNALEGNQISGFLNILKQNGYKSDAIIASNSKYYNSKNAYKSIGFDKTIFLEEIDDFQPTNGDVKIFDGDLYDYSFNLLKKQNNHKSYIHYILGMYGHFPYDRNVNVRPDIITSTHSDNKIHRIANQFYYRTDALGTYISNILSIDPTAIIFISSDHLPPILNDTIKYKKSQTENIALLLIDSKVIDINGLFYYDVPRVILKLLNKDNTTLKKIDNKIYEDIYLKALSQSLFL